MKAKLALALGATLSASSFAVMADSFSTASTEHWAGYFLDQPDGGNFYVDGQGAGGAAAATNCYSWEACDWEETLFGFKSISDGTNSYARVENVINADYEGFGPWGASGAVEQMSAAGTFNTGDNVDAYGMTSNIASTDLWGDLTTGESGSGAGFFGESEAWNSGNLVFFLDGKAGPDYSTYQFSNYELSVTPLNPPPLP